MSSTNGTQPAEFDWTGIVNQAVDAWPEPEALPTGYWQFSIKSAKLNRATGKTTIVLKPSSPIGDTVSEEAAANVDLENQVVFASFKMNRYDDVARLKQFIRSLGLGEYNIEDALKAMKDAQAVGEVTHSPKNDGTDGVYVNVRRLGPVTA